MLNISQRAQHAPASPIRKLSLFADQAKARGIKVYHLNIGQPDFKLPPKIQSSLKKISRLDYLPYANSLGIAEHIAAWQSYYRTIGIPLDLTDIAVTTGGTEALMLSLAVAADPGDEVVVFEPFFANYAGFANMFSIRIVPVALDPNNGYHLPSIKTIESAITGKTKAILFTNPNNPTGTVFTKEEILIILKLAKKHDLFIIADETYRGICFDHKHCYSFLDLAKGRELDRIIVTDSLSKRLNVCGARIGAIICKNKRIQQAVTAFCQTRLCSATIEQIIVSSQLANSLTYVKNLAKEYQKRRDAFINMLERELKTLIHRPEGAFYTMVQLPNINCDDFAKWLLTDFNLKNETVMVAPGSGFYQTFGKGRDEIRVAYVLNERDLRHASHILAAGVKKYKRVNK